MLNANTHALENENHSFTQINRLGLSNMTNATVIDNCELWEYKEAIDPKLIADQTHIRN
jgi:hypothetical protein